MQNNIFDRLVLFLDRTEVSFVTLLAKIIPFLVPIIPAYVGYKHITDQVSGLGFDPWAGLVYAAVIEGLGYAAIYKAVQFWEHNRKYTAEKNQAPLTMAIVIYAVYLIVTLLVNVLLDYKAGVVLYKVVALAFISLLSVPAGLLMSISAIHTERTAERERQNEQTRTRRNEQRTNNERTPRTITPRPNERRTFSPATAQKRQELFEYVNRIESSGADLPGVSQIARDLGMSKGYVSDSLKERK